MKKPRELYVKDFADYEEKENDGSPNQNKNMFKKGSDKNFKLKRGTTKENMGFNRKGSDKNL
jgi:hypothetical protein